MTYRCIDQLQTKAVNVASLCRLLEVSRSGYYAARSRARSPQKVCSTTVYRKRSTNPILPGLATP